MGHFGLLSGRKQQCTVTAYLSFTTISVEMSSRVLALVLALGIWRKLGEHVVL